MVSSPPAGAPPQTPRYSATTRSPSSRVVPPVSTSIVSEQPNRAQDVFGVQPASAAVMQLSGPQLPSKTLPLPPPRRGRASGPLPTSPPPRPRPYGGDTNRLGHGRGPGGILSVRARFPENFRPPGTIRLLPSPGFWVR